MSLKDQASQALAAIGTLTGDSHLLTVTEAEREFSAELTAVDRLACAFARMRLETAELGGWSTERLESLARALADRITYLLEAIDVVEVDADRAVVQLRSRPPHHGDGVVSYYELVVRSGGEIALRRFTQARGAPRVPTPAEVTHDVFARLAADFAAAIDDAT